MRSNSLILENIAVKTFKKAQMRRFVEDFGRLSPTDKMLRFVQSAVRMARDRGYRPEEIRQGRRQPASVAFGKKSGIVEINPNSAQFLIKELSRLRPGSKIGHGQPRVMHTTHQDEWVSGERVAFPDLDSLAPGQFATVAKGKMSFKYSPVNTSLRHSTNRDGDDWELIVSKDSQGNFRYGVKLPAQVTDLSPDKAPSFVHDNQFTPTMAYEKFKKLIQQHLNNSSGFDPKTGRMILDSDQAKELIDLTKIASRSRGEMSFIIHGLNDDNPTGEYHMAFPFSKKQPLFNYSNEPNAKGTQVGIHIKPNGTIEIYDVARDPSNFVHAVKNSDGKIQVIGTVDRTGGHTGIHSMPGNRGGDPQLGRGHEEPASPSVSIHSSAIPVRDALVQHLISKPDSQHGARTQDHSNTGEQISLSRAQPSDLNDLFPKESDADRPDISRMLREQRDAIRQRNAQRSTPEQQIGVIREARRNRSAGMFGLRRSFFSHALYPNNAGIFHDSLQNEIFGTLFKSIRIKK